MAGRGVVHWECRAQEHRTLRSRRGEGGLTIHEGAWAYCDGDGADDAHEWVTTGGVALESLVRWSPTAAAAASPAAGPERAPEAPTT